MERILAALTIALACSAAQAANVNVLYLYTQAGQTAVGGPSSLAARSGGQNADTNDMLLSAGITGGAINVGNATITTCCVDPQTGLDYGNYVTARGPAVALIMAQHNHEIAVFRDAAGADIVVVVIDDGGAGTDCGVAWNVPQLGPARGIVVVRASCLNDHVVQHEIGHEFGLADDSTTTSYDWVSGPAEPSCTIHSPSVMRYDHYTTGASTIKRYTGSVTNPASLTGAGWTLLQAAQDFTSKCPALGNVSGHTYTCTTVAGSYVEFVGPPPSWSGDYDVYDTYGGNTTLNHVRNSINGSIDVRARSCNNFERDLTLTTSEAATASAGLAAASTWHNAPMLTWLRHFLATPVAALRGR